MEHLIKLLVTDDEEGMRLGIERALRGFSATFEDLDATASLEIQLAEDGEEALRFLNEQSFGLSLMDYKLPGQNGIDVMSTALLHHSDILFVMMTAYASLDTAVTATKRGAFDFLAKPFTPAELRATVRKAVRHLILQKEARKLAEEKKRMRFEFISVLSHELKAPIAAVEGYLDLIRNGQISDEETLQKVVQRSLVRLHGMRKLIFDLLDLTRIESGTKKRNLERISATDTAASAMELLETTAAERGIQMELNSTGPGMLTADRGELDIIFNNLISNAVKYNREDGSVAISIYEEQSEIRIEVSDTGIGMTSEEAGRLFGEFVRIRNARTRGIEGSGLGLSTVRKIARLYGGDVSVRSVPDNGSVFTVRLKKESEMPS